jgi:hypothetical protein
VAVYLSLFDCRSLSLLLVSLSFPDFPRE